LAVWFLSYASGQTDSHTQHNMQVERMEFEQVAIDFDTGDTTVE